MIGKNDPGIDREGSAAPNTPNRFAQETDAVGEQSIAAPLQQVHSEKFTGKK
jgi:hypothetical protein